MAIEAKEIIAYVRKGLLFSLRTSYRCARNHPVVLGMVFFMFILYRAFPALFAFLVSSSPVIICTALLLGTLLSYGEMNIPEIEEEKKTQEISSLKVGNIMDDLVVEEDESFMVENHTESRTEIEEETALAEGSAGLTDEKKRDVPFSAMLDGTYYIDNTLLASSSVDEGMVDSDIAKKLTEEAEVHNHRIVKEREFSSEWVVEGARKMGEDGGGFPTKDQKEVDGLKVDIVKTAMENHFGSSLGSPWHPIDGHDASSGSESDRAESSSPDASMADIIPMLDELHPLLDSEPRPAPTSIQNSDSASSSSSQDNESDDDSAESANKEVEVEDEEKGKHEEKNGDNEVLVSWTADDRKNVMDLGISELERNQRLENLIAKRRARKLQRFETEKNLIDLDSHYTVSTLEELSRFLGEIGPISVPRRNPFDLPYGSEQNLGLPIPGSAPSVLQPRKNPFDLPYDLVEERSSLMGGNVSNHEFVSVPQRDDPVEASSSFMGGNMSNHEFLSVPQRDMFNGRDESFTSDTAIPIDIKPEKNDSNLGPSSFTEEEGFAAFHRAMSIRSTSYLSSSPESDVASSVTGQEDRKDDLSELEAHVESEMFAPSNRDTELCEQDSLSSKEVEFVDGKHEKPHQAANTTSSVGEEVREEELDQSNSKVHLDAEVLPLAECGAESVEQHSHSFKQVEAVNVKNLESGMDAGDGPALDLNISAVVEQTYPSVDAFGLTEREIEEMEYENSISDVAKLEAVRDRDDESVSLLPEENGKSSKVTILEEAACLEQAREDYLESPCNLMQSTPGNSGHLSISVEKFQSDQIDDPLYDSSPSAVGRSLSNISVVDNEPLFHADKEAMEHSSLASDVHEGLSEVVSPSRPLEKSIPVNDSAFLGAGTLGEDLATTGSVWVAPTSITSVDEHKQTSMETTQIREADAIQVGSPDIGHPIAPLLPESAGEIMHPPTLSSVYTDSSEGSLIDVWESLHSGAEDRIGSPPSTEKPATLPSSKADSEESHTSILELPYIPGENLEDSKLNEGKESKTETPATYDITGLQMIEERDIILPDIGPELSSLQISSEEMRKDDDTKLLVHVPESGDASLMASSIGTMHDGGVTELQSFELTDVRSKIETESDDYFGGSQNDCINEIQSNPGGEFLNTSNVSDEVCAEGGEIKGIDEGLLYELDAVGDFWVEELKSDRGNSEVDVQSDGQFLGVATVSSTVVTDVPSNVQFPHDKSIESIHMSLGTAFEPSPSNLEELHPVAYETEIIESEVGSSLTPHDIDPETTVYNSKLHVLEACSVEELNSIFKQLHEEALMPPSDHVIGKPIRSDFDAGSSSLEITVKSPEGTEAVSELLVLEAKSPDNISSAGTQLGERDLGKTSYSEVEASEGLPARILELMGSSSDVEIVEGKSPDDADLTLNQVSEGAGSPMSLSDHQGGLTEVEASKRHLEPQVIEVKSAEETDLAFKEVVAREPDVIVEPNVENSETSEATAGVSSSSASTSKKIKKKKSAKSGSSSGSGSSSSDSE